MLLIAARKVMGAVGAGHEIEPRDGRRGEDGLDCGAPQSGDGDAEPNTDRHTPHTLAEAVDALEADKALCEALDNDLVRVFTAIRRDELRRWDENGEEWSVEAVSDWELEQYLPFY